MASDRFDDLPPDIAPTDPRPASSQQTGPVWEPGDNLLGRFGNVVFSPGRAMEQVKRRPRWALAGLLIMACLAVFTSVVAPIAGREQFATLEDMGVTARLDQQELEARYEEATNPTPLQRVKSGVLTGILVFAGTFLYGLVFLLFSRLAGGRGTFAQVMGVTYWSALIPYGFASLVKLPLVLAKQSVMAVSFSPAVFMSDPSPLSAAFQAATTFGDLATWWGLAIAVVGMKKIHGFTTGQAVPTVVLPWLAVTAAFFGIARLLVGLAMSVTGAGG